MLYSFICKKKKQNFLCAAAVILWGSVDYWNLPLTLLDSFMDTFRLTHFIFCEYVAQYFTVVFVFVLNVFIAPFLCNIQLKYSKENFTYGPIFSRKLLTKRKRLIVLQCYYEIYIVIQPLKRISFSYQIRLVLYIVVVVDFKKIMKYLKT